MADERKNPDADDRRALLTWLSRLAMGAGLVAAYGTLAAFMGRFLYPARPSRRGWQVVSDVGSLRPGQSLPYRLPDGTPVNITRRGRGETSEDFLALSSTCPHLGCQVHWEPHNGRFFCPCHNGVFTPEGEAIDGPPAEAGQWLPRYPVKVERGVLLIEVPLEQLATNRGASGAPGGLTAPGHDRCLSARRPDERAG